MAATTHRWHATDGDYENTANWDSAALPGSGGAGLDTAICDGVSQQAFTTNLDRETAGDNPLKRFITMPLYRGDIGGPANPLTLEIISPADGSARVLHRGTGQFYYKGHSADYADVFVNTSRSLATSAMILDGVIRNLWVMKGKVEILSTCSVTQTIWVCGHNSYCVMNARSATESIPTKIIVTAGVMDNHRITSTGAGNVIVVGDGGELRQYGLVQDATSIIHIGAVIRYAPNAVPSASTNPQLFTNNGLLDLSTSAYDIEFDNLVIGPWATVNGSAEHVSGDFTPLSTFIDMREDYP